MKEEIIKFERNHEFEYAKRQGLYTARQYEPWVVDAVYHYMVNYLLFNIL